MARWRGRKERVARCLDYKWQYTRRFGKSYMRLHLSRGHVLVSERITRHSCEHSRANSKEVRICPRIHGLGRLTQLGFRSDDSRITSGEHEQDGALR